MSKIAVSRTRAQANCKSCGGELTGLILDLGALPPCNRFLSDSAAIETHPLMMTECTWCGLTQLAVHPPTEFVLPRVPWLHYNEPDGHLDEVAGRLLRLSANRSATAIGVGPFDRPLLERLARYGIEFSLVGPPDEEPRLIAEGKYPYLETFQARLRPVELAAMAERHGRADLVVCRYLLEHSHDPLATLVGLNQLIAADGMLLIEVPDSRKFLSRNDYSFVWEEHICYFTAETILGLARRGGYEILDLARYYGWLEDALVILLRPSTAAAAGEPGGNCNRPSSSLFSSYQSAFGRVRSAYRSRLEALALAGSKLAVYGIGHQAVMFVNALGLQPHISMMVDDDPNKLHCFAPGATTSNRLPGSHAGRSHGKDLPACHQSGKRA